MIARKQEYKRYITIHESTDDIPEVEKTTKIEIIVRMIDHHVIRVYQSPPLHCTVVFYVASFHQESDSCVFISHLSTYVYGEFSSEFGLFNRQKLLPYSLLVSTFSQVSLELVI